MFAYVLTSDNHRRSVPVPKALNIKAALCGDIEVSELQAKYLETIKNVYIHGKRLPSQSHAASHQSRLIEWDKQRGGL